MRSECINTKNLTYSCICDTFCHTFYWWCRLPEVFEIVLEKDLTYECEQSFFWYQLTMRFILEEAVVSDGKIKTIAVN